jgi:hypothetical protein
MYSRKISLFVLLLLLLTSALPVVAQDDPGNTDEPDGPAVTLEPEDAAQSEAESRARVDAFMQEYARRSIFDFRVAYLIASSENSPSLVSAEGIQEITGAAIIDDWNEFVLQNEETPFNIVMLHGSMADAVDTTVIRDLYRSNVIIVGLNIDIPTLTNVIGDDCMAKQNRDATEIDGDSFVFFSYSVEIVSPVEFSGQYDDLTTNLHEVTLETCEDLTQDIYGNTALKIRHGATASFIETALDLQGLVETLVAETIHYRIPAQLDLQPLP